MRDYATGQTQHQHQKLTGPPMEVPLTALNLSHRGASMEDITCVHDGQGDAQAAVSAGLFGTLKRAGRP